MPNKKWNNKEVAEIKIMKKSMTAPQIAEKLKMRLTQINYALYSYLPEIPPFEEIASEATSKIKTMAEVRERFEQPKRKTFLEWLFG